MLLSFKKDRALVNVLSDLEIILSEMVDKLDVNVSSLSCMSLVDNTRKYRDWNKIQSIDTSNYIQFLRYDREVSKVTKIALPWKGYDETKDISVKVFLNGILLVSRTDYTIRATTDNSNVVAGYTVDFGPYLANHNVSNVSGTISIFRTTTTLPTNVSAIDITISRYDNTISGQRNHAIPWGTVGDNDLYFEVYVNGVLYTENTEVSDDAQTNTYKVFSTYIYFNKSVSGTVSIIRYHKSS